MRTCGDCSACCTWLEQNAYGHTSGKGKSCGFLSNGKCSIYEIRPKVCSFYECAWKQNLLPDWMKPNECGIIVSVLNNGEIQYLDIIETDRPLQKYIKEAIEQFCVEYNCGARYLNKKTNELSFFGPPEFLALFDA